MVFGFSVFRHPVSHPFPDLSSYTWCLPLSTFDLFVQDQPGRRTLRRVVNSEIPLPNLCQFKPESPRVISTSTVLLSVKLTDRTDSPSSLLLS